MDATRRKTLGHGLGLLAAAALPRIADAESAYPNAPIRFIIPTASGGGHDSMMRIIGQKLTESMGQPVIVESKSGASGAIAASYVAKAPADGYTLLLEYSAYVSNAVLNANPGYKMSDLAPVSMLAITPIAIGVRQSLGVDTLQQYVALAKSSPGKLTYGSYGQGSGGNFVGELLNVAAGIETVHVPYKGETPALLDLLGGQIDAVCVSIGGVSRYPGRIKPLAVSSSTRFPLYATVPTFAESGYAAVNMPGFGALFAPAGTPKAVMDKLALEMARIVRLPDVAPKLLELGFEPAGWDAGKLADFLKDQLALTQKLVSSGRVKL